MAVQKGRDGAGTGEQGRGGGAPAAPGVDPVRAAAEALDKSAEIAAVIALRNCREASGGKDPCQVCRVAADTVDADRSALREALRAPPQGDAPRLRSHRCIDDGGDGYECPGCHAAASSPRPEAAPAEQVSVQLAQFEIARARAEARLQALKDAVRLVSLSGPLTLQRKALEREILALADAPAPAASPTPPEEPDCDGCRDGWGSTNERGDPWRCHRHEPRSPTYVGPVPMILKGSPPGASPTLRDCTCGAWMSNGTAHKAGCPCASPTVDARGEVAHWKGIANSRRYVQAEAQRDALAEEVARLNASVLALQEGRAGAERVSTSLAEALREVEAAMTWALDRSPEACQAMVKESAPWRVKARAALAGVRHGG